MFRSADRGAIWARSLEIMRHCGKQEEAWEKAATMLNEQKVQNPV